MAKNLRKNDYRGLLFAAPGVAITAVLIVYPMFSVLYLSFFDANGHFVGFRNFVDFFKSSDFSTIIRNTLVWTLATVVFAYALGTVSALAIQQDFVKAKGFWRSVLMLSWITPGAVKATVWKWIYSSDFGILNHILLNLNLIREPVSWLTSTHLALPSVMLVQVWATFPFVMLMISAGLQAIPKESYEVAYLEGASAYDRIRHVIMPLLKDVTFITILILVIWSLNEFAVIWIITQGGPAGSSQVLSLSIYDQFRSFNINGAAAISVLQLAVSFLFAAWYIRKTDRVSGEDYGR